MGMEARWDDAARRLTLRLVAGSRMLPPLRREIDVRVAGSSSSKRVTFSGRPLTLSL
jgi:hypothetical protein